MVSLPINFHNKSFIGNRRPFLLKPLKQPPFMAGTKMNADRWLIEECKIGWVEDKSG
jgi:hypothetical protein